MPLLSETALTYMCAQTLIKRAKNGMECFLRPLWLPVETVKMVFINYVDCEMFSLSLSNSLSLTLPLCIRSLSFSIICVLSLCRGPLVWVLLTEELLQRATERAVR